MLQRTTRTTHTFMGNKRKREGRAPRFDLKTASRCWTDFTLRSMVHTGTHIITTANIQQPWVGLATASLMYLFCCTPPPGICRLAKYWYYTAYRTAVL